ncbi:MAG TPA: hypothetical protein V6D29_18065 [Leptolyngbyaceae cyanobacterium]
MIFNWLAGLMLGVRTDLSAMATTDWAYLARSHWATHLLTSSPAYGSIAFEYEKNSYPLAMADLLAGDRAKALAFLQQLDPEAEETQGIDLYSGFVLKGQIRKYFYFGDRLDPAYRQRMWTAMHEFTKTDPLTRQAVHPRKFWSASTDDCTTAVDCRNTDNLRAMRETSVYLMAEETGNEETRLTYKARLQRFVHTLYDIGMGEWDSPTYHGHTTAAYLNLYDFAQDPEVKQLAKEALDWLFRSAALKYWRGSWDGPLKRPGGDGAAQFFWLYFGDAPSPQAVEKDWIHGLTSRYRPPEDIVRFAHRQFSRPVEIRRTHPHYENWKPGKYGPAFYETLYFGHTFQLGSLAGGTGGDWQGFSLRVAKGPSTDALVVTAEGKQQIAQYENLLLWRSNAPPVINFPEGEIERYEDTIFIRCEQTWIAIWQFRTGFAMEVGEPQSHGSFDEFKAAMQARSHVQFWNKSITYQSSDGRRLKIEPQEGGLPNVWRNNQRYDWKHHTDTTALPTLTPVKPPSPTVQKS